MKGIDDHIKDGEKVSEMRRFAELVVRLGTSTKTNDKLEMLAAYFAAAEDADKVWVIALFSGRRPKRTVNTTMLWEWCRELTGLPAWLFEESYHTVGDLAETIALLLPGAGRSRDNGEGSLEGDAVGDPGASLGYYLIRLMEIGAGEEEAVKKAFVQRCWAEMNSEERFVFNKLITGGFRIGVSQKMMVNALAQSAGVDAAVIAHRITGDWDPATTSFSVLLSEEGRGEMIFRRPYHSYHPQLCPGRRAFYRTGRAGRMAGGMEMGWDKGGADPSGRAVVCLEPGGGIDDGEVPGIPDLSRIACRRGLPSGWGDYRNGGGWGFGGWRVGSQGWNGDVGGVAFCGVADADRAEECNEEAFE